MNLTTVHSLWLAPLCLLLGAAVAWWAYRRAGAHDGFGPRLALVLAMVRGVAVALLAFLLLEPMLRAMVREVVRPVVVVAHDGSSSLRAAGDTAALRNSFPAQLNALVERLGDKYDVRTYTYGDRVREGLDMGQTDALTDIGQLFRTVYDGLSGPDLGAIVITGDGIQNRGRDPRLEAARSGVPVFTVALGDTTVRPDVLLRTVDHNRINYLGNTFPLVARVEARALRGSRVRVAVQYDGRVLEERELPVSADPWSAEVPFTLKADRPGLQRYTVEISAVEGEATAANNAQDIYIDVLDARQKVLLLAASPHPDLGAIRSALSGMDGYTTELAFADAFTGSLGDVDLLILQRLPSAQRPVQQVVQAAAARGVPVLAVLGQGMDMAAFNAMGCGVQVSGTRAAITDASAVVDRSFSAFVVEDDMVRAVERFPPLQVPFGQYEVGRSASSLLLQRVGAIRTPYPLVTVVQQQERRMATVTGEGLWRWRLADMQQNGDHQRFDRLVHKLVQFLALKANKERFRVEHATGLLAGDAVLFSAELYNASLERVNDPEVELRMKDEEGREYTFAFSRAGDAYRLDAGRLPAGRYTWMATTSFNGEAFKASGELVVRPVVAEQLTTVADHGLLADLAVRSGGLMVQPGELDQLEAALRALPGLAARSYAQASYRDLIDLPWVFVLLLVLLTVEWVTRRRNGAY